MSNEVEKDPEQQKHEQGKHDPTGSVNPSDKRGNQSQSNPTQDVSKKNPSQGSDSQHQGQQKPEDEKRRAS
jgi:hypothetical protein